MSNTLGSIILPEQTVWADQRSWSPVKQQVDLALSGKAVVYVTLLPGTRPITLRFDENVQWSDQTTVDQIEAMGAEAGAVSVLVWEGVSYNVMFRHQEPPAVVFNPIWPFDDRYFGFVKLMTV